jgi:hypothetical protein
MGTTWEKLKSKGFPNHEAVHGIKTEKAIISLKSLAIPAGFEPATHRVEIRYSTEHRTAPFGVEYFCFFDTHTQSVKV